MLEKKTELSFYLLTIKQNLKIIIKYMYEISTYTLTYTMLNVNYTSPKLRKIQIKLKNHCQVYAAKNYKEKSIIEVC